MRTRNILSVLAFAILLTTACNKSEIAKDENIVGKGYALPVTINVTRQGDEAGAKATFNESTRKLEFSDGDKLFVNGSESTAGKFAGMLDYDGASGQFSGTITTQKEYSGTAQALIAAASSVLAILLPNGYLTYGYLSITNSGYDAEVAPPRYDNAFAPSKATAVEQFSHETANYYNSYSNCFALLPVNAILNFTITDLTANTEVAVIMKKGDIIYTDKSVTTDGSGTATFAIGEPYNTNLNDYTITVGGKAITLVSSSKVLERGKIYNITRSAIPYKLLNEATADDQGKVVCVAGHLHNAKTAVPAGCIAVGILGKVTSTGRGLILALRDATSQDWYTVNGWSSVESYAGTTLKLLPDDAARGSLPSYTKLGSTTVSNWCVAQKSDYEAIFTNLGSEKIYAGSTTYDDHVNAFITTGVGGSALSMNASIPEERYWSATSFSDGNAWYFRSKWWDIGANDLISYIRPVLAF